MSISVITILPKKVIATIAAFLLFALTGCQSPSLSGPDQAVQPWRVLERVGRARSIAGENRTLQSLRPGDEITGGRTIATGEGGLLIMGANGVQLTVGENTSIHLAASKRADLALDHGWLRFRIATAVNREARIKTESFEVRASNTTLTLRAHENGADLSVDTGSAALSSTDGHYHVTVAAGEAAKIDRTAGDALMIRQASSQIFEAVQPVSAADPESSEALHSAGRDAPSPLPRKDDDLEMYAPTRTSVARLASRLNEDSDRSGQAELPAQGEDAAPTVLEALSPRQPVTSVADPFGILPEKTGTSASKAVSERETEASDPLDANARENSDSQIRFDLLMDGLVDRL